MATVAKKAITKIQAIAVIVVIVVVAVVGVYAYYATLPPAGPEEIKLGVVISLTGAYSEEGTRIKDGFDFFWKQINEEGGIYLTDYGRKIPVELIYYDDKSETESAVAAAEKLITVDEVPLFYGCFSSTFAAAVAPIADKYEVPYMAHANAYTLFEGQYEYLWHGWSINKTD